MATATQRQPPRQPPPSQGLTPTEEAALAALVVAILSGLAAAQLAEAAVVVLRPLGLRPEAIRRAVGLLWPHLEPPDIAAFGALGWVEQTSVARQAAYIRNAATRLDQATDLQAVRDERRYLHQHIDAERGRRDAARRVNRAAERFGPVLGWYSVLDPRTTHGCAQMAGRNFRADTPPMVEGRPAFPGMVHVYCRCSPGAPHPGAVIELAFDPNQPRDWHGRWTEGISSLFTANSRYVSFAVSDVTEAIDRVHSVPVGLPKIPVEKDDGTLAALGADGGLVRSPDDLATPQRILLDQESVTAGIYTMHSSLVHEIGHYLDLVAFKSEFSPQNDLGGTVPGRDDYYASKWADALVPLRLAAEKSAAIQNLRRRLAESAKVGSGMGDRLARYLLKPHEVFARAYFQWIATRSGDEKLLQSLRRMQEDWADVQWDDADFEPIARELDKVFRERKWLK